MKKIIGLMAALLLSACSGTTILNTLSAGGGTVVAENVVYDENTGGRLDIYTPPGNPVQSPTVVFLHGGRWTDGDKSNYVFVGKALAERGYVVVIPNYRKYPQVKSPVFVQDAARAVKWTRTNIYKYGGSGLKLFVMGHSSGAQMAALLAMNEEYLAAVGGTRGWFKGMIGLAGPYDFLPLTAPDLRDMFGPPERYEQSQPIFYADGQNAPLLLLHGEDDDVVWVKNTRNLADAVRKKGGPVETVIYPKLSHSLIVGAMGPLVRGQADVLDVVTEFMQRMITTGPVLTTPGVQPMALPEEESIPAPSEGVTVQPLEVPPENLPAPQEVPTFQIIQP